MSNKSARPVKNKQEAMFDQVKNALTDVLKDATQKAQDRKQDIKDTQPKVTAEKKRTGKPLVKKTAE